MKDEQSSVKSRREFLRLAGNGAAVFPLMTIAACSGGDDPAPASSPAPAPKEEPAPSPSAETEPADSAPAAGGAMPQLSEDDPQAKSLGYVHDTSSIDRSSYPRYEEGQACANCALYQGGDADWGACSIFPGRQVKATGWCNV